MHNLPDYPTEGNSPWLKKQQAAGQRSKRIIVGIIIGVLILVVVGVAAGVSLSKKNSSSSSSASAGSPANPDAVNQTDPNDPSTFVKNPNLHQSFYGMAYTPDGSQLPNCGNSLANVITDIQLLSQLTKRIRLYGADCNQTALVLEAIQRTKVDMQVWVGNYPVATDNNAAYDRQRDTLKAAIQTYGTSNIAGMTVGNEFELNYLNDNGGTVPNSAVGDQGAALIIADITDTRSMLTGLSLPSPMPVGNADAGSYFNTKVLQAVDYGMANVHPWFANVSAEAAAGWTAEFFQENNVEVAAALSNNPKMYIAETGWPTQSSDVGNESNGPGTAAISGLQTFLDTFVCQANTNGTGYFFFEFADEPWKDAQFGGVEGWWGLFNFNRTLKNVNIPNCQSP
ncbi:glycoside hydrolase [Pluteus cervinus]|uniref:Glycoside hydrolase n=1 Tax=Pluteus cervinus TaxID=181527 RepID=A0ACD3A8S1_9AGAR|nr:glycoside hydrolase [Pluteus cervinus]